jgi:hypothetical protein
MISRWFLSTKRSYESKSLDIGMKLILGRADVDQLSFGKSRKVIRVITSFDHIHQQTEVASAVAVQRL